MGRSRVTWVLTREPTDAAADLGALRELGLQVVNVSCIECVSRPWPSGTLSGATVVFLTSRRAAEASLRALKDGQLDRRATLIAALAPATVKALGTLGADVVTEGGSTRLAEAVHQAWLARGRPEWTVFYPTSDAGLETAEQAEAVRILQQTGPVKRAVVYETRAPAGLAARLSELPEGELGWHFASPSAVAALFNTAPPQLAQRSRFVVCHGRSTLDAFDHRRASSWPPGQLQSSPLTDTLLALERSFV